MSESPGWIGSPYATAAAVAGLILATWALDRRLRRLRRGLAHRRVRSLRGTGSAGRKPLDAAAFAHHATGLAVLCVRAAVWLAVVWAAGEISPSLRFARSFVSVVGRTAVTAPVVMFGERGWSILDFVELPALLVFTWVVINALGRTLEARLARHERVDAGTRHVITLLGRCVLAGVSTLAILHAWGVDVRSLTIAASVVGVGVGFGLQNVTSNFVSGVLVSFERPIRPGDFVRVGEFTGTVERIGLRCTEILTVDRVSILVPNSQFLEKEVVNWTHGNPLYRLRVRVCVADDSDIACARAALLEAAGGHRAVLRDPAPRVEYHGFGDGALRFELLVWARDPKRQFDLSSDLQYRIATTLARRRIRLPYSQHDVCVRSPDVARLAAALCGEALRTGADECGCGQAVHATPAPPRVGVAPTDVADALRGEFDDVYDAQAWTDDELDALAARMRSERGVAAADRRHRLRVYERCFVGSEAVDWVVAELGVSRSEAVDLGRALLARGSIHHVVHEQPFRDGRFFYRFGDGPPSKREVRRSGG